MAVLPPTAALAGVPAGVQANGPWIGRRQLFVRFAAEAETATMYTPDALANEVQRLAARSSYHSISVSGRDPMANTAFLRATFEKHPASLPVMLDCDGQRPDAVSELARYLALFQVTLDGTFSGTVAERAMESIRTAAAAGIAHALVLGAEEQTSDGQILRMISQAHLASDQTVVVVHPVVEAADENRRWLNFMEQATALHGDVRLLPRLPRPTGMR